MPTLASLLDRFRRALLPPGPAAPALGVPADRRALVEAEVGPLLGELAALEVTTSAILATAEAAAARLRTDAGREAADALAAAHERIPPVRADAEATARRDAEAAVAALAASAATEAERLRARAAALLPGIVDESVAELRAALLSGP